MVGLLMGNKSEMVWKAVVMTEFEVLSLVFKE
jgi:heme exporter protein D